MYNYIRDIPLRRSHYFGYSSGILTVYAPMSLFSAVTTQAMARSSTTMGIPDWAEGRDDRFVNFEPSGEEAEKQFGFGGVITYREVNEEHLVFECPLPASREGYREMVSLNILLLTLSVLGPDHPDAYLSGIQLLVTHGGSYAVSSTLRSWLCSKTTDDLHEIAISMDEAYKMMDQPNSEEEALFERRFKPSRVISMGSTTGARVSLKNGIIHLNCPGINSVGLDPTSDTSTGPNHGYRMSGHNVDVAIQKLTLLAGMAKLYDLARSELDG